MSNPDGSKGTRRSETFTTLELNGGYDCGDRLFQRIDLDVHGGARVRKTLCAENIDARNITVSEDVNVLGDITADDICADVISASRFIGNISGSRDVDELIVSGNLILQGCLKTDCLEVSGNLDVAGDLNVAGNLLADCIEITGDINVAGDLNIGGNVSIDQATINGATIDGDIFGNVIGSVQLNEQELANAISQAPISLDPTLLDAFGRQKVSNPFTLLDSKFLADSKGDEWDTLIAGGATLNQENGYLCLDVTNPGDRIVRQSRIYAPYQPGKGLTAIVTGTLEVSGNSSVTSRIGIFDDDTDKIGDDTSGANGYFYELSGGDLFIVERTDISGVVTETRVPQSSWNVDRLDGTGPSGSVIDVSKRQIFVFELEWLGVGTATIGFFLRRKFWISHVFYHANLDDVRPYISRPTLPVRYELTSDTGVGTMTQICATVISDGGYDPKGDVFSDGKIAGQLVSIGTAGETPLVAIRLRSGFRRVLANILNVTSFSQSGGNYVVRVYVIKGPTASPITGGTWRNVNTSYSAVEINSNPTSATLTNAIKRDEIYVVNQVRTSFAGSTNRFGLILTSSIEGYSDVVVVTARTFSGTVNNVSAAIQWQEFE